MNKNNRTDAEEAAMNQGGGILNQVKGHIKQAVGDVIGSSELKREGRHDRVKGNLQEAYGKVKEQEAELERDLNDISSRGRV